MPQDHAQGIVASDQTAVRLNITWDVDGFAVAIGQVDMIVSGCHETVFRTLCLSCAENILVVEGRESLSNSF
jgi:hypothetical protein